jgi:hypothetical protein
MPKEYKTKYCDGCKRVWQYEWVSNSKKNLLYYLDYPTYGLDRENCQNCEVNLDLDKIHDLEWEGVDGADSPDFVDAHITYASYEHQPNSFRDLTERELEWLCEEHSDWCYDKLLEYLY